jgi:multidrug resistance protein, MATE family
MAGTTRGRPIASGPAASHELASSFAASFVSSSPLAQQVLARDLAECSDDDEIDDEAYEQPDTESDDDGEPGPLLYRRPSNIAFGSARPAIAPGGIDEPILTRMERHRSRDAERSLLRDNHLLPPKHPVREPPSFWQALYKRLFSTKLPRRAADEELPPQVVVGHTENSPLLGAPLAHDHLNDQWEAAVAAGQIKTTIQREAKTLIVYSRSLVVTFLLQYSLNVTSIFAVGHIGKLELGAVSLASMTASITCYAPIQGVSFCLGHSLSCANQVLTVVRLTVGHVSRHALLASLWVGSQAPRWTAVATHDLLSASPAHSRGCCLAERRVHSGSHHP